MGIDCLNLHHVIHRGLSQDSVPSEVLSDRGRAFLSGLMREVELLLGFLRQTQLPIIPRQMVWWSAIIGPLQPC